MASEARQVKDSQNILKCLKAMLTVVANRNVPSSFVGITSRSTTADDVGGRSFGLECGGATHA